MTDREAPVSSPNVGAEAAAPWSAANVPSARFRRALRRRTTARAFGSRWVPTSMIVMAAGASAAAGPQTLQLMTSAQVMAAGTAGTGCSWSLRHDRRMRFAAADNRAAIRIDGRTIVLAPAPRARELFPFTYADWSVEGVTVRVREIGKARWLGSEASTSRATLTVVIRGVSRRIDGTLSCGS